MMRLLVTGGAGFIGSNFIRTALTIDNPPFDIELIINLDKLTYAAHLENLKDLAQNKRLINVFGDIQNAELVRFIIRHYALDTIVHFAAETHVDRSIEKPAPFYQSNIFGTTVLSEMAIAENIRKFIHISTDEVYGSLSETDTPFQITSPLAPNNPYAASKAAADMLIRAYLQTYGLPAIIVRPSNNYGPYQSRDKLIPLAISHALKDQPIPLYGDGRQIRDWLFVRDHVCALLKIIAVGQPGEIWHISAHEERRNIDVLLTILKILGKPESLISHVPDRKAHDRRYALDARITYETLGWRPQTSFEEGLLETVRWYELHPDWGKVS